MNVGGNATPRSPSSPGARCGDRGASTTNVALNLTASVSSECWTPRLQKSYLTDGMADGCPGGDQYYWHSCQNSTEEWASLDLSKDYCVRDVTFAHRCDCCGDRSEGIFAEVLTSSGWQQCGGLAPSGLTGKYSFSCALVGREVRLRRYGQMNIVELEVYPQKGPRRAFACCARFPRGTVCQYLPCILISSLMAALPWLQTWAA